MKTQIIYDNAGYIISIRSGEPAVREPMGIPFLVVDIPQGKQLKITDGIGVNTSVRPHVAILEDVPLGEVESLRRETAKANTELFELIIAMAGG